MNSLFLGRLKEVFYCDLRSLAAARIIIGISILMDLVARLRDYELFLTDSGVIPLERARDWIEKLHFVSLYTWNSHPLWAQVLLAMTALGAISLILGFKTRVSTVVCWILMVSLQNRTYILDYPGDWMTRLLLFWGMFLPLGSRFSIDSKSKNRTSTNWVFTPAFPLLLLQMVLFFWVSGLSKVGAEWFDGTAVSHVLRLKSYAKPSAIWLSQFHGLNEFLTYLTLAGEWLGPFLLISPWNNRYLRWFGCFALATMVFVFGLFINFEWLGVIVLAGSCAILPPEFWDWILPRSASTANSSPFGMRMPRAILLLVFVAIVNLLYMNLVTLRVFGYSVPIQKIDWLDQFNARLRLDQFFIFFPTPRDATTAWGIFAGIRNDGNLINLLNESEKAWEEPETMVTVAPTFRQLRGMNNAMWNAYEKNIPTYSIADVTHYYCNKWRDREMPLKGIQWWIVLLYREKGKVVKTERVQLGEGKCSPSLDLQSSKTKS